MNRFFNGVRRSPLIARLSLLAGVILLVSLACGLPASSSGTPTAANTPVLVSTATAAPSDTAVPAATQAPTNTPAPPTATQAAQPPVVVPTNTSKTQTNPPAVTKAPAGLSQVTIYFIAVGDAGKSGPTVGCGDALVAVKQNIEPTTGVIRAALTRLFSFKQQNIGESGLYNALYQSDLRMESGRVDNGVATIYITGTVKLGGECDTPRFKGQIEQTILAQQGVKSAVIYLNGKPIDQALSLK